MVAMLRHCWKSLKIAVDSSPFGLSVFRVFDRRRGTKSPPDMQGMERVQKWISYCSFQVFHSSLWLFKAFEMQQIHNCACCVPNLLIFGLFTPRRPMNYWRGCGSTKWRPTEARNDAFAHRSTFPLESNNTHGAKRYLRDLPKSEYELIKPIAERHVYALHGHRVPLVARYQGFPTRCCTDINVILLTWPRLLNMNRRLCHQPQKVKPKVWSKTHEFSQFDHESSQFERFFKALCTPTMAKFKSPSKNRSNWLDSAQI